MPYAGLFTVVPVTVSSMSQMPPNEDVTMRCAHLPPSLGSDSMRGARYIRSSSCNSRRQRRESLQVPSFWRQLQLHKAHVPQGGNDSGEAPTRPLKLALSLEVSTVPSQRFCDSQRVNRTGNQPSAPSSVPTTCRCSNPPFQPQPSPARPSLTKASIPQHHDTCRTGVERTSFSPFYPCSFAYRIMDV